MYTLLSIVSEDGILYHCSLAKGEAIMAGKGKPNVLLIVLDTLRRDRLSTYGNPRETSPELDAFAADATVFERAISPSQWTIPAHASIFTGLYPSTHQVLQGYSRLSDRIPTLAELLAATGYRTVAFCNNGLVGVLDNGLQRGFERFYNYAGATPNRPFESRGPLGRAIARRFRQLARRVENQFAHSDALFRFVHQPWITPLWTRFINFKGHTEVSINDLVAYWQDHLCEHKEQPLFVFLNLMGTHLPYAPPREAISRVAPELHNNRRGRAFVHRLNGDAGRWSSPPEVPLDDRQRAALRDFHDVEIAVQDVQLGRLFRTLDRMGTLERTLIIIVADHGEVHGAHDFFGHGFSAYQELVHVPLIIRGERFPNGARVTMNVSTRRIFHTVLEAAGIQPRLNADDPNANVAQLTLTNTLDGRADIEEGVVYAEAFPPEPVLSILRRRGPSLIDRLRLDQVRRAVVDGSYKLITVGGSVEGLYEITTDPAETYDVSSTKPELTANLQSKLDAFVDTAESLRVDGAKRSEIGPEAMKHLRALGYID